MTRTWGTAGRRSSVGDNHPTGAHGIDTQRDAKIIRLKTFPLPLTGQPTSLKPSPSYYLSGPPEPFAARRPLVQALLDIGAIFMAVLFVCITGVGIGAALVILLTVAL